MLKNNMYCCKLPSFCWAICILLLANACTSKSDNSNIFDPIDALMHDQQEVIGQIILEVNNSGRRTADLKVLSEVESLISLREKFGIPVSKEMYSSKLNVNNINLYISNLDSINKHSVLRFPASNYEYIGRLNHNLINYELSVTNNISILSDLNYYQLGFLNSRAKAVGGCSLGMTPFHLNSDNKDLKIGDKFRGILSLEAEDSEDVSISYDNLYLKIDGDSINAVNFEELGGAVILEFLVDRKGFYELHGQLKVEYFKNSEYGTYPVSIRVYVGPAN